ncbi:RdRp [Hubei tetragnatha maxillosa virus 8]|uniref:RdRp n=1 Tax=Hubei tetragnatha maxillosa virus 8 TaxID=1923250 RepID=UPI000909645E|nr:RdRp [Hubei tetragnatha maxillosa virus 8]APG78156.1 RdRp [Hubei tetragnatha maxillosa virus 8]APG78234.1 RdRp [Hubei tetragnatha maxillosa virus 8]APG78288.1 RdRp [Hubei tetragnatha maxillosa virus 8]
MDVANERSKVLQDTRFFKPLPRGTGFPFNYQPSRLDRNALFALNRVYDPEKISEVRTKYHRAKLNMEDLRTDLLEYSCAKVPRIQDDSYYMIFESVDKDIFGDMKVIPLTHGAVANHPDLPRQKSPGLPYKTQGYATKGEALDDPNTLKNIRATWYAIERSEDVTLPDVACYARAQICSRDKNKIRATWGYPLSVFLTEAQYFYPILKELKQRDKPKIAYGVEIGTGGMGFLNEMASYYKTNNFLIGDWRKFDKTIPAWLIRDAFRMIMRHIDLTKVQSTGGRIWPVRASKTKKRLAKLINYFIDTPVQLSSGERFVKHGGVPSGSSFTNLIDGIVNAIVTRYTVYSMTGELPYDDLYLGDDIVAVTKKPLDLHLFAEIAEKQFSMIFNPDKSYQTSQKENIHFLGYYNIHGMPYKPVDTVIASSIYPERPCETKFETITRLIGQAYSCFEPEDAKRFFLAAQMLQDEVPGLTNQMITEFTKDHTHWFKYLQTVGVSTRDGLTMPKVRTYDQIWITAPQAPRRKWSPVVHDLEQLAQLAYEKWKVEEEDNIDST